jgi:hypothetical protein
MVDTPADPVGSWSSGNGTGPLAWLAASVTEASPPRAGTGRAVSTVPPAAVEMVIVTSAFMRRALLGAAQERRSLGRIR